MCNICGCSIDPAEGSLYEKHFKCLNCGNDFKATGVAVGCPSCRSKKIKRVR
ncbi:MAG TPA: hypothetical protein PLZ42_04505 [Methanothrix sp.]|nr:hypothetical protein [Methanothrix sp.]